MTEKSDASDHPTHLLNNKLYDILKILALIVFPAIGTLYFTVAGIWRLPAAEEVVSTIVAIDTFLGVLIKVGDMTYNASEARYDGAMVVTTKPDGNKTFSLDLKDDPEPLADKKEIIFKVKPEERNK